MDAVIVYNSIMALFSLFLILGNGHPAPSAPQLTQDELNVPGLVLTPDNPGYDFLVSPEPATDDLVILRPQYMTWEEIWVRLNCDDLPYKSEDSTICM